MSLRFIIGRAGTGKTRACLDAVREKVLAAPDGPPLVVLVPEQASFQTEYSLTAAAGMKGFMRVQVLSFRRLAYRVLLEVGGAARAHIGELGKRMVLRRIMDEQRDKLLVFGRVCHRPGFADTMARTLGELKIYCVSPEDIAVAFANLEDNGQNRQLITKLSDVHLLYTELEKFLADRFTDPDDYLNLLADRLVESRLIKVSEIWVDGFTGFTPQEYMVLAALMRTADKVNVALCTDSSVLKGGLDEGDLFYPSWDTYKKICEIAYQEGIMIEPPLILDNRDSNFINPAIAHLEKNYFRRPAWVSQHKVTGLLLASAANRWAEVEGVAGEIVSLCRDKGYRYRDILVLVRDLEAYGQIVSFVFSDHRIPVFIDQKRPIMSHPLVELVRSALETLVRNWAFEPVFRYLKTGLTALSREEVDLLENYVLACGVRGNRWTDHRPWEKTGIGDQGEIDRIRRIASLELACFSEGLRKGGTVREFTQGLFELLTKLNVPDILAKWSSEAQAAGVLEKVREHSQVWGMLVELLDQIVETLGDETLNPSEYAAVLDAGLEGMGLGLIPPGLDQVVAGTLDRSRNPSVRACFIMGVNEGVLPARVADHGLWTESEREALEKVKLNLSPSARRRVFDEQYYVYLALTRATEYLVLSYPTGDEEGGAGMPSPVLARIKELLPEVAEKEWSFEPNQGGADDLDFITNPRRSLSYLAISLREAKNGSPL
ncbi:MAG: exodeoxyribonuclease V subunit gamma, partial [Peptococcaceae bacterium]|nr:exodeoxyribonuclease V subunit gamma [Peptococcaceae bacterium]